MCKKFSEKLKYLWKKKINTKTGKKYTASDIAVISTEMGESISYAHWYKILKGEINPRAQKAHTLSKIFDVSLDYLLEDNIEVSAIEETQNTSRSLDITMRARNLSKAELRDIILSLTKILDEENGK